MTTIAFDRKRFGCLPFPRKGPSSAAPAHIGNAKLTYSTPGRRMKKGGYIGFPKNSNKRLTSITIAVNVTFSPPLARTRTESRTGAPLRILNGAHCLASPHSTHGNSREQRGDCKPHHENRFGALSAPHLRLVDELENHISACSSPKLNGKAVALRLLGRLRCEVSARRCAPAGAPSVLDHGPRAARAAAGRRHSGPHSATRPRSSTSTRSLAKDRLQAVGNGERRDAPGGEIALQEALNVLVGGRVDGGGGLVAHQQPAPAQHRARNAQPLQLAQRQLRQRLVRALPAPAPPLSRKSLLARRVQVLAQRWTLPRSRPRGIVPKKAGFRAGYKCEPHLRH